MPAARCVPLGTARRTPRHRPRCGYSVLRRARWRCRGICGPSSIPWCSTRQMRAREHAAEHRDRHHPRYRAPSRRLRPPGRHAEPGPPGCRGRALRAGVLRGAAVQPQSSQPVDRPDAPSPWADRPCASRFPPASGRAPANAAEAAGRCGLPHASVRLPARSRRPVRSRLPAGRSAAVDRVTPAPLPRRRPGRRRLPGKRADGAVLRDGRLRGDAPAVRADRHVA